MFEDMLKDMLRAYGPSGREDAVAEVIRSYVAPHADEVSLDAIGNLIAYKKGTSGKKLMLCAHMDQIGLAVTDMDDKGFLRAARVGGVNATCALAREVVFANGTRGVTYFETETKTFANADFMELFIDIGASSLEEAQEKVSIGDMAVFASNYIRFGERVSSAALDNRLCCAAIAEAFITTVSPHDVYAVFSAQEEVGCRGAGAAAYAIQPDLCINVDITLTGDTPKAARCAMALGQGVAVKAMDLSVIVPQAVRGFIQGCAQKAGVAYQDEVIRRGGTDAGVVQRTRGGVAVGGVSIPVRYTHTPVETADMRDVQGCIALLHEILASGKLPVL